MFLRRSRCRRIRRCSIPRSRIGRGYSITLPAVAQITRLSVDPDKGMAGRTVQAVIDVLEGNYGGDPTKMPYVVNKEAFGQL